MANKRELKKNLNEFIFDIVDELFDRSMQAESKAEPAELLIDEAAEFRIQILGKIANGKSKPEFKAIVKEIEDKADYFVEKINSL